MRVSKFSGTVIAAVLLCLSTASLFALEASLPVQPTFSCDSLAASAKEKGLFVKESDAQRITAIKPGSFFLVRRTSTDWEHTGIVLSAEGDVLKTIEGNTNDDGSREGYEVCRRIRNLAKKDFVVFA